MSPFRPRRIDLDKTAALRGHRLWLEWRRKLPGWRLYVVNHARGRCIVKHKALTVPSWAWRKSTGFVTCYLAHEISHAVSGSLKHDKRFYDAFKLVCPLRHQHFELRYKPRNAARNGIGREPL